MEMYKDKFVVAVKANGKVLRETKDLVKLPFGSEFSVLVKNLNSRRAKFTLHIDGTDVLDGTEIIVNANSEIEMKRFIRNGNMNEGNAFKFIERTAAIEDGPRGIKIDDGVIRVEFWFEQEKPIITTTIHDTVYRYPGYHPWNAPYWPYYHTYCGSGHYGTLIGQAQGVSGTLTSNRAVAQGSTTPAAYINSVATGSTTDSFSALSTSDAQAKEDINSIINDAGITVPGSKVEQKFSTVYGFNAEAVSHVLILRMVGMVGKVEITVPVTVKTKCKCETCGKQNKANANFCSSCGTALELL